MKRWMAFVLVLLMVPAFCFSEGTNPFSFNGFTLGMDREELDQKAYGMGSYILWDDNSKAGFWFNPWKVCQRYNARMILMPSTSLQMVLLGISTKPQSGFAGSGFENDEISMEDYDYIRRAMIALYGEENPNPSELFAVVFTLACNGSSLDESKALFWEKENVNIFMTLRDVDGDEKNDVAIYYMSPDYVKETASFRPLEIDADLTNTVPSWYAPLEETSEAVDTTGL